MSDATMSERSGGQPDTWDHDSCAAEALHYTLEKGRLSISELALLMMSGGSTAKIDVDTADVAVRWLVRHGLLHREGDCVCATVAARMYSRLLMMRRGSLLESGSQPE